MPTNDEPLLSLTPNDLRQILVHILPGRDVQPQRSIVDGGRLFFEFTCDIAGPPVANVRYRGSRPWRPLRIETCAGSGPPVDTIAAHTMQWVGPNDTPAAACSELNRTIALLLRLRDTLTGADPMAGIPEEPVRDLTRRIDESILLLAKIVARLSLLREESGRAEA